MSLNQTNNLKNSSNNNGDISSFYLKQVDNTLSSEASRCSPSDSNCSQNALTASNHMTHSIDVLSVRDISTQVLNNTSDYNTTRKSVDTLLTFATASNNPLRASSKCRNFTQEINILKSQLKSINGIGNKNDTGSYNQSMSNVVTYGEIDNTHDVTSNDGKYSKIQENSQKNDQAGTMRATTSQRSKDHADLYEVESTII